MGKMLVKLGVEASQHYPPPIEHEETLDGASIFSGEQIRMAIINRNRAKANVGRARGRGSRRRARGRGRRSRGVERGRGDRAGEEEGVLARPQYVV